MSDLLNLVRTLARYMRDKPHACDSSEGIHRWWLPDGHKFNADEIEMALDWMAKNNLVLQTVAADGRVRFSRISSDARLDAILNPASAKSANPS